LVLLSHAAADSGGVTLRHTAEAVLPRRWAGRVSPETQQGPSSPTGHRSRSSACAFRGRACVRARERSAPRVRDTGGQVARIIVLGAALAVAGVTLRSDTTAKSTITISQLKSEISALLRRTCAPHAGSPAPTSPSMKLPRVVHSVTASRRVVSVTHVEYRLYPGVTALPNCAALLSTGEPGLQGRFEDSSASQVGNGSQGVLLCRLYHPSALCE